MKNKLLLLAVVAALSACGGGGGDETTAPSTSAPIVSAPGDMTKYAGTWISSCIAEGQGSARIALELQATSKSATGRLVSDGYVQPGCTGPTAQLSVPITVTYVEMVGAAEKIAIADGVDTTNMLATMSESGRSLTMVEGTDTFTFTKQ